MKEKYPRNCQVRVSPAWHLTKLSLTGPIQSQNKSRFIEDSIWSFKEEDFKWWLQSTLSGSRRRALNIVDRFLEEILIVEDDAFQGWFFGSSLMYQLGSWIWYCDLLKDLNLPYANMSDWMTPSRDGFAGCRFCYLIG